MIRPQPDPTAPDTAARPRRAGLYSRGQARVSLVLGILSILTLNALLGLIAIGLGRAAQRGSAGADPNVHRRATTGVLTGCIGAMLSVIAATVLILVYVFALAD